MAENADTQPTGYRDQLIAFFESSSLNCFSEARNAFRKAGLGAFLSLSSGLGTQAVDQFSLSVLFIGLSGVGLGITIQNVAQGTSLTLQGLERQSAASTARLRIFDRH